MGEELNIVIDILCLVFVVVKIGV
jgi:hypothetical protein